MESVLKLIQSNTKNGVFSIIADEKDNAIVSGFGDVEMLRNKLPDQYKAYEIEFVPKHPYQHNIDDYFSGNLTALKSIKIVTKGSNFQKSVYRELLKTRPGTTVSYKKIAQLIGSPNAYRAIGSACRSNRLPLLVPCHRIVKHDGKIGNYIYGIEIKKSLLSHEHGDC